MKMLELTVAGVHLRTCYFPEIEWPVLSNLAMETFGKITTEQERTSRNVCMESLVLGMAMIYAMVSRNAD